MASCLKAVLDARATPPTCASGNPKATYVAPTDGVICVFQVRGVPQRSLSRPQYRAPKAESLQGTAKIRHHVFQGICGATPRITMPFSSSYTDYGRLKYSCNESDITRRSQLRCYTMIPIKADILQNDVPCTFDVLSIQFGVCVYNYLTYSLAGDKRECVVIPQDVRV